MSGCAGGPCAAHSLASGASVTQGAFLNCPVYKRCSLLEAVRDHRAVIRPPTSGVLAPVTTSDDALHAGLARHRDELRPAAVARLLQLRGAGELTTGHVRLLLDQKGHQLLDLPAQFSDPIPCSSLPPLQFLQPRHHRRLPAPEPWTRRSGKRSAAATTHHDDLTQGELHPSCLVPVGQVPRQFGVASLVRRRTIRSIIAR